jgi:hypothetical protein
VAPESEPREVLTRAVVVEIPSDAANLFDARLRFVERAELLVEIAVA